MRIATILFASFLPMVGGCASIIDGTSQTISVTSNPDEANCRFTRETSVIASFITPSGVVVEKTKHDITLSCEKEGYQEASSILPSDIEDATWGNIILGGFIGWGIDSASGADNKYPDHVSITLLPQEGGTILQSNIADKFRQLDNLVLEGLISEKEASARKQTILDDEIGG